MAIEVMTRQRETVMTLGPIRAPISGFGPVPALTPHIATGNMASADLGPLKPADLPMLYNVAEVANMSGNPIQLSELHVVAVYSQCTSTWMPSGVLATEQLDPITDLMTAQDEDGEAAPEYQITRALCASHGRLKGASKEDVQKDQASALESELLGQCQPCNDGTLLMLRLSDEPKAVRQKGTVTEVQDAISVPYEGSTDLKAKLAEQGRSVNQLVEKGDTKIKTFQKEDFDQASVSKFCAINKHPEYGQMQGAVITLSDEGKELQLLVAFPCMNVPDDDFQDFPNQLDVVKDWMDELPPDYTLMSFCLCIDVSQFDGDGDAVHDFDFESVWMGMVNSELHRDYTGMHLLPMPFVWNHCYLQGNLDVDNRYSQNYLKFMQTIDSGFNLDSLRTYCPAKPAPQVSHMQWPQALQDDMARLSELENPSPSNKVLSIKKAFDLKVQMGNNLSDHKIEVNVPIKLSDPTEVTEEKLREGYKKAVLEAYMETVESNISQFVSSAKKVIEDQRKAAATAKSSNQLEMSELKEKIKNQLLEQAMEAMKSRKRQRDE